MFWTKEQFQALKIGDKIRRYYYEGNPNNKLMHVRGWVDGQVVVRTWFKRKQRWNYEILIFYDFTEYDTVEG